MFSDILGVVLSKRVAALSSYPILDLVSKTSLPNHYDIF